MRFTRNTCPSRTPSAAFPQPSRRRRMGRGRYIPAALAVLCLMLAGCATGGSTVPSVTRLTTQHYAPTQTVDVLSAAPDRPFTRIAQLKLTDPTGSATRSQLIAQLSGSAKDLGANAIVVAQAADQPGGSQIGFNPSGGQMQGSADQTSLTVSALAIRYSH